MHTNESLLPTVQGEDSAWTLFACKEQPTQSQSGLEQRDTLFRKVLLAADWIRCTSADNSRAIDAYMLGATDIEVAFAPDEELDVDFLLLSYFLRHSAGVGTLRLWGVEMTILDLEMLSQALVHHRHLRDLCLFREDLSGGKSQIFAQLMKRNSSIHRLLLNHCQLGDVGVSLLCDALDHNSSLSHLNLSLNSVGLSGVHRLAKWLHSNQTLVSFTFTESIGVFGYSALTNAIRGNSTLKELRFGASELNDEELQVFIDLLICKTCFLTELDLGSGNNSFSRLGIFHLAEALRANQSLETLSFAYPKDEFDRTWIEQIFVNSLLQENVTLRQLKVSEHSFVDPSHSSHLRLLLWRNETQIPSAVRRVVFFILGMSREGDFGVLPKDVVKLIVRAVWDTRKHPRWIQALKVRRKM